MNRRKFLYGTFAAAAGTGLVHAEVEKAIASMVGQQAKKEVFKISLAEWSLHRALMGGQMTNLDFPQYAKDKFGITAVEYVNLFFKDKAKDMEYLKELKTRTANEGITNVLIMCDGEGHIGAQTEQDRKTTVENHKKWVEAAHFLGCHTIRVNGHGHGGREEAAKLVADGLHRLATFAKDYNINVVVENHGGLSSDGQWLSGVLKEVNMDNCGALPDFGNFFNYDRYKGIEELMPFAKGVSAKSREFDENGFEKQTDYFRAMDIVVKAGYTGHVGIEFEGGGSEDQGIQLTLDLLNKVRAKYAQM